MPRAWIPTIRIGNVEMKNLVLTPMDALLDDRLLDVHVKRIQQQPEVSRAHVFD